MKSSPVLEDVDFGEEAAEADTQLESYFVETNTFRDVVADRIDLVLGAKGSGKSAIFRRLALHGDSVNGLEDVDIITAFNLQGTVIFKTLSARRDLSEAALRTLWTAFIVAVVGYHLIETYWAETDLRKLKRQLKRAGLSVSRPNVGAVWGNLETAVANSTDGITVEGEAEATLPGVGKAKGRFTFGRRRRMAPFADLEALLHYESELLELLGRQAWILFDRLDEAFTEDRVLERKALRALLRTHLDVTSHRPALRSKLCLRTDVLARITVDEGFVNATHLRRHFISWDRDGIVDLVVRRLAASREAVAAYQIEPEQLQTRSGRQRVCELVLPRKIHGQDLFEWIEAHTTDAQGALNPRNVISLLRLARSRQLDAYDRDAPEFDPALPLIGEEALVQGFVELSAERLSDTVLAEANHLRPHIERLRNRPARFGRAELAELLHLDAASTAFEDALASLSDAGVLAVESSQLLGIPRLYRPALDCRIERGASRLAEDEQQELRARVDVAVERLRRTRGVTSTLPEIDRRQRDFIVQHIRARGLAVRPLMRQSDPYSFGFLDLHGLRELGSRAQRNALSSDLGHRDLAAETGLLVARLAEQVMTDGALAISEPLDRALRRAIELSERRREPIGSVRLIANLQRKNEDRVAFAADLPGVTLGEQDEHLDDLTHMQSFRNSVAAVMKVVLKDRFEAHLRPMGPRAFAEVIGLATATDGVTYRIRPVAGGVGARVVLHPIT